VCGARVLVVDDEIVVARLMQEILVGRFGCRVDLASRGIEALERLTAERYSLVISDIRMPEMNGTELFLWLRETQPAMATRLVFVTGHAGEKHLEEEIAQWSVPVLMKPFTVARFAEVCGPFLQTLDAQPASA
jgi:CheY-like chemotaxis protein